MGNEPSDDAVRDLFEGMVASAVRDYRKGLRYGVIKCGLVTRKAFPDCWSLTRAETVELVDFLFGDGLQRVIQLAHLRLNANAVVANLEPKLWKEIQEIVRHRKRSEMMRLHGLNNWREQNSTKAKKLMVGAYSTGTLSRKSKTRPSTYGSTWPH